MQQSFFAYPYAQLAATKTNKEQLANSIGISFQAVSKWENNLALSDISLAPILASYFGVSMDELFDFNLKELELAVDTLCKKTYQYRESDVKYDALRFLAYAYKAKGGVESEQALQLLPIL